MTTARFLLNGLNRIEAIAAMAAYVVVAALLIGDVIGREVLSQPIFGAQKMAVFAAIVAGFLGLSIATAANAHLRPMFMDRAMPAHLSVPVERLGDFVAGLFYVFMAWVAVQFVQQSFLFNDKAAVIYWPLWPIQLIIPYALCSSAVRHLIFAVWPTLKPASGNAA